METNSLETDFRLFSGLFISYCSKIEHMCHIFLIEYYVKHDEKLTPLFIRDFLSKKEIGFSGVLNSVYKILLVDKKYRDNYNPDILNKSNIKMIIEFRNLLAHSHYSSTQDESHKLLWFNSSFEKNEYARIISQVELNKAREKLIEFNNYLADIIRPIIKEQYPNEDI